MSYRTPAIGRGLRLFREQQGKKSKEFAILLGVSASHYSELEAGKRSITDEVLERLAKGCRVPTEDLRGLLLRLANTAAQQIEFVEAAGISTGNPKGPGVFREEIPAFAMPGSDALALARDLVDSMPRDEVFRLLRRLIDQAEAGDAEALRKVRGMCDTVLQSAAHQAWLRA